jgi:hypothetical protein
VRQFREGLGDEVEESLGFGFPIGGAALVVLEVAQGGLGVGIRQDQTVSLTAEGGRNRGSDADVTTMALRNLIGVCVRRREDIDRGRFGERRRDFALVARLYVGFQHTSQAETIGQRVEFRPG